MIIVSSHRPHMGEPEWARNQIRANRSWEVFAKKIFYFGENEKSLKGDFVKSEQWPTIKEMAAFAAWQDDIVCLTNADIVLSLNIGIIERMLRAGKYVWAHSRRWHFDPDMFDITQIDPKPEDRGRDVWIAHSSKWKEVAEKIPDFYRIGHQQWDKWMGDHIKFTYPSGWIDITGYKIALHPIHGGRKMPFASEIEKKAPK